MVRRRCAMKMLVRARSSNVALIFFMSSDSVCASSAEVYIAHHISMPHESKPVDTCRFVEEQYRWVFQQRTSHRKPLLFAARHHQPALSDCCRVSVWEYRAPVPSSLPQ